MSKENNLTDFLTDTANAIRSKKGYPSTQKINPQNFSSEIASISGGGLQGYFAKVPLGDGGETGVLLDSPASSADITVGWYQHGGNRYYSTVLTPVDEVNFFPESSGPLYCYTIKLNGDESTWTNYNWSIEIYGWPGSIFIHKTDLVSVEGNEATLDVRFIYVIVYDGYIYVFLG